MCGINGFNFKNQKLIKSMNECLKHRGPDDDGYSIYSNLSIGQTRLSIIDLSKKGHQPMKYSHKNFNLEIVFNGEIYNYLELKKILLKNGYKFNSNSDTEVILASYIEWGKECVKKFNGMWAFCIYDINNQYLFLSKDRFGKKPLYYYFKDNKFIFSSEIKSILNHKIKREIDKNSFQEFLTYRFTFDDKTMFKNIFNFKPAYNMIFDLDKSVIKEYYMYYELKILPQKISYKHAKQKTKELIEDSIKKRMISDVPVAVLLSGGLDSSIITYYAKKFNSKLNTFSIGFDKTNELPFAKIVANHLKTNHFEFKINKDIILDYLDDMIYHMDEPIGADPGFLPIYILSKEVRKYNKVVLTGDSADEIFAGYDRYKLYNYSKYLKYFSFKSKNQIINRLNLTKNKDEFESFIQLSRVFEKTEIEKMGLNEKIDRSLWPIDESLDMLTKAQIFDIKTLLVKDLFMKSDKMSSSFGLEQRTPFMDYRIVEFGLTLPIEYKLKGLTEKYILKDIAKEILPSKIVNRKKHGFNVPIDYWFENILGKKLKTLLKESKHELYNKQYILELLENLKNNKTNFKSRYIIAQKLWSVLLFEMWHKWWFETKSV